MIFVGSGAGASIAVAVTSIGTGAATEVPGDTWAFDEIQEVTRPATSSEASGCETMELGSAVDTLPLLGPSSGANSTPFVGLIAVPVVEAGISDPLAARAFEADAIALLSEHAFEDGMHHPLEELLAEVLATPPGASWICVLWSHLVADNAGRAATLLRCLGMLPHEDLSVLRDMVIDQALAHDSLRVREAAVMALERWADERSAAQLREALTYESVPWLKEYLQAVLEDL